MSGERTPLISVIVAVFNGKATLQQCIDSVAQQTYPNKQLIVIDGASRDGTVELLQANSDKLSYWVSEPDRGIYHAWNKGLAQARGEWVCFLGADDYFHDNTVLERMAPRLAALPPDIRVAYGQIELLDADGTVRQTIGEPWPQVRERFRQDMCIPHVGTMHRRSLFELHGPFDESFRIAADYELLLRELKTGEAAFMPNIITAAQRFGGVSTQPGINLRVLREAWRAQRIHGQWLPRGRLRTQLQHEYSQLLMQWLLRQAVLGRVIRNVLDLRRRLKGLPPHWTKI